MINMLWALMATVDSMQKQLSNVRRDTEIPRRNKKTTKYAGDKKNIVT